MKRIILTLGLIVAMHPVLRAEGLTTEERDKAIKYLEKTRSGVFQATKGLSQAQWNFKPTPDRWSVAEVTEHIAAAEDLLRGQIQERVLKAPPRTDPTDVKAIDEFVLKAIPDRSRKAQAPEPLRPTNRFGSPQESLKHFKESRDMTIELFNKTKDLREHATDSPLGKKL